MAVGGGAVCERLRWSEDGSILSVCAADGAVHSFLARMPVLHAAYGTRQEHTHMHATREHSTSQSPPAARFDEILF